MTLVAPVDVEQGPTAADVPSTPVLEARGLGRSFGHHPVVRDVDLSLAAGTFLTVFGPNGAGKTTLLRLLAGSLRATTGEVLVRGRRRERGDATWRGTLGMLSHQTYLYGHLTAEENLRFYARLHGLRDAERLIAEGLDRVGLSERADARVRTFSRGMRQRLGLARTLLHDPDVVFLDEPYTGLDAHASRVLRRVLQTLKDGRRTVVMVTHNIAEGLELADRVAIQVQGRLVEDRARGSTDPESFAAHYLRVVEAGAVGEPQTTNRRRDTGPDPAPGTPSEEDQAGDRDARPRYLEQVLAIVRKDLVQERRTRGRLAVMATFAALVGILFWFSIDAALVRPNDVASGLIWMTVLFAGLLGVGRTFHLEAEDGAFQGVLLSPVPEDAVFLAKALANFVLLAIVIALIMAVFGVFFTLDFGGRPVAMLVVLGVGGIGFAALATLFAAVATATDMGETLLPVLIFPLLVPVVINGTAATGALLHGRPLGEVGGNLRMLVAFSVVAVYAGALLFRHVVEE